MEDTRQTIMKQILGQMASLSTAVATHIAGHIEIDKMISAMYKILVTGNGCPPLPETVRQHEKWIQDHNKEQEVLTSNARQDRNEAVEFKRQIWIVVVTEVIGFVVLAIEISLHMK